MIERVLTMSKSPRDLLADARKNLKRKMDGGKTGYVCLVDYDCELGRCPVTIYDTLEALKEDHPSWDECGIAKVSISIVEVVVSRSF